MPGKCVYLELILFLFWKEVPANGIYSVDLRKLGNYFSSGDANSLDVQAFLRRYPWQQPSSNKYPVCPVPNQFNREILDYDITSTPPPSTHYLKASCHSLREDETASPLLKENSVNDIQDRNPDNLGVCSGMGSSDTGQTSIAYSQVNIPTSFVNRDAISKDEDTTSVTQSVANFHINTAKHKGKTSTSGKADGHPDHTKAQEEISPCSTKDGELSTARTENLAATGHSSKLFPNNDKATSICAQPCPVGLDDQTNQCPHKDVREGNISQVVVEQFANILMEAVRRRVFNLPRRTKEESDIPTEKLQGNCSTDKRKAEVCVGSKSRSNVGILFSGGIDSIVLAALADRCIPSDESIDLINVAFEQRNKGRHTKQGRKHNHHKSHNDGETNGTNFDVPDRVTGRNGVAELRQINPHRTWNFVEVNVTLEELQKERSNYITHLVSPQSTVLDDSIGCALWFAARGKGNLTCKLCYDEENNSSCNYNSPYTCPAKVLLVGMGADEQLGGYARHRSRFNKEGWKGLVDEIEMEVQRISERNLGRDDRCISDHGRESRCPFLDEDVVSFLNALPVWIKCDPRLSRGIGEKIILRHVAKSLGLTDSSELPKRAIQFGSRIAKLESSNEKGSEKCSRF